MSAVIVDRLSVVLAERTILRDVSLYDIARGDCQHTGG